jgi:hypothetical protein
MSPSTKFEAVELALSRHLAHGCRDPGADVTTGLADRQRDQRKETLGVGVAHHHRPVGTQSCLDPVQVSENSIVGEQTAVLAERVRIHERYVARAGVTQVDQDLGRVEPSSDVPIGGVLGRLYRITDQDHSPPCG